MVAERLVFRFWCVENGVTKISFSFALFGIIKNSSQNGQLAGALQRCYVDHMVIIIIWYVYVAYTRQLNLHKIGDKNNPSIYLALSSSSIYITIYFIHCYYYHVSMHCMLRSSYIRDTST